MDHVESAPSAVASRTRHWPLFLAGVLLFFLGPVAYIVQFRSKHLGAPWYVPILASVGVALMILSIWRRRGVVRPIGLVLFAILCGLEWHMLLVGTRTPAYTGPAQAGHSIPEFTATLADGRPFTEKDLEQGTHTVLLFFRGRW